MKRKKLFIWLFIVFLLGPLAFYLSKLIFQTQTKNQEDNVTKFQTFEKKNNTIAQHPTTPTELKRVPSALRKSETEKDYPFHRQGRVLLGQNISKFSNEAEPLNLINSISKNWRDKLGKELIRFQPDDVKLTIHHEISAIDIQGNSGRHVEKVIVTFLNPDGLQNSFRAMIDSDSGKILDTWDRTHTERPNKIKFTQYQEN
jgi:hypothetical protein